MKGFEGVILHLKRWAVFDISQNMKNWSRLKGNRGFVSRRIRHLQAHIQGCTWNWSYPWPNSLYRRQRALCKGNASEFRAKCRPVPPHSSEGKNDHWDVHFPDMSRYFIPSRRLTLLVGPSPNLSWLSGWPVLQLLTRIAIPKSGNKLQI